MKVLIVEDDPQKASRILDVINARFSTGRDNEITVVDNLSNAIRLLAEISFNLIVMDLMLPYLSDGQADSRAGLELLRQLRSVEGRNSATAVVGISAFPSEIAAFRDKFQELGVLIVEFDEQGGWSKSLLRILEDAKSKSEARTDLDFLVVCALEDERQGFSRTDMIKVSDAVVRGLNIHYVRLRGDRDYFGGIMRLGQMGLVASTYETAWALNTFSVKILSMSGICAGFKSEVNLGQVVVGSPAWEYQAGKWAKDGFQIAPTQIPLISRTRAQIDHILSKDGIMNELESKIDASFVRPARPSPPVLAPFVTGSAVVANEARLAHIEHQHRKVAALDMETFGVYFAAHESSTNLQHYFSAKCVVDLADSAKDDDLHRYGCAVSARTTEILIRELLNSSFNNRV